MRIGAASDDQFVAVARVDHGLNGDALEMLRAGEAGHRFADFVEGSGNPRHVGQIELYTADVGLVGDRVRKEFQSDGVSGGVGGFDGLGGRWLTVTVSTTGIP